MELVACKNILLDYFDLIVPKQKNDEQKSLQASIENSNNKIKISSEYLKILEDFFKSKGTHYYDFFQTFITNIVAENRVISFNLNTASTKEDDIILESFNYNLNDYSFIISKFNNHYLLQKESSNICVFENISKPNKDWLVLNILSGDTVDVDYSNFQTQKAVSDFVSTWPLFSKKIAKIEIIDSYFNVGNHNLIYSNLKSSKSKIKCYSRVLNGEDKTLKRRVVKDFFGKRKTSVSFSSDTKITHERKISIGKLIIEFTHDPAEIRPQNKNWTIYLKICENKARLFQDNVEKYNAT